METLESYWTKREALDCTPTGEKPRLIQSAPNKNYRYLSAVTVGVRLKLIK